MRDRTNDTILGPIYYLSSELSYIPDYIRVYIRTRISMNREIKLIAFKDSSQIKADILDNKFSPEVPEYKGAIFCTHWKFVLDAFTEKNIECRIINTD